MVVLTACKAGGAAEEWEPCAMSMESASWWRTPEALSGEMARPACHIRQQSDLFPRLAPEPLHPTPGLSPLSPHDHSPQSHSSGFLCPSLQTCSQYIFQTPVSKPLNTFPPIHRGLP